jgi:hypothetical protein
MEKTTVECNWTPTDECKWTPTFPAYESYDEIAERQCKSSARAAQPSPPVDPLAWEPAFPVYESYDEIAERQRKSSARAAQPSPPVDPLAWKPAFPAYESYDEIAERQRKHRVEYTKGVSKANVDIKVVNEVTNTSVERLVQEAEKSVQRLKERVDEVVERAAGMAERTRVESEKIKVMEEKARTLREDEEKLCVLEESIWMEIREYKREMEEKERKKKVEEKERNIDEVTKTVEDMTFEEEMKEKTMQIAHLLENMDRDEANRRLDNLPVALNQLDPATRKVIQEFKNRSTAYNMRRTRDSDYVPRLAFPAPEPDIRERGVEEQIVYNDFCEESYSDLPALEDVDEGFGGVELESQSEEQSDGEWDKVSQDGSDGEGWEEMKA